MSARTPPTTAEAELRRELWLHHGHDGIYGDDGEMQCSVIPVPTDFKRDDFARIASHLKAALDASEQARQQAERERDEARQQCRDTAQDLAETEAELQAARTAAALRLAEASLAYHDAKDAMPSNEELDWHDAIASLAVKARAMLDAVAAYRAAQAPGAGA